MKNLTDTEMLRRFTRDSSWIHRRFERLRKQYPGQFVAVYNSRLVARARSIPALEAKLQKICPGALSQAAVQYLPKKELVLLLFI